MLDHVAVRAGFLEPVYDNKGRRVKRRGWPVYRGRPSRTMMFRHAYTAVRLQTLDHGAPVNV